MLWLTTIEGKRNVAHLENYNFSNIGEIIYQWRSWTWKVSPGYVCKRNMYKALSTVQMAGFTYQIKEVTFYHREPGKVMLWMKYHHWNSCNGRQLHQTPMQLTRLTSYHWKWWSAEKPMRALYSIWVNFTCLYWYNLAIKQLKGQVGKTNAKQC